MVLSQPDILRYLSEGSLKIDPPVPRDRVAQVSIDLSLGRKFTTFKAPPAYLPAIHVDPSLWTSEDLWHHFEQDVFRLEPGQFVLAQTLERVLIPHDLVGLVEGRSSWARLGITIHVTAPKITLDSMRRSLWRWRTLERFQSTFERGLIDQLS